MKKIYLIVLSILIVGVLGVLYYFREGGFTSSFVSKKIAVQNGDGSCITGTEEKTVTGDSMHGVIEAGSKVQLLRGYYECNDVQRGDVVAYRYAAALEPIIKIVKGIPSDRFSIKKKDGVWSIFVNDQQLTTSSGAPHVLSDGSAKLLSLYEKDYRGVIPKDAYLIFGNLVSGSFDSSQLGLVGRDGMLGKVMMP